MMIRKALPGEEEKILDLYYTLIDLMKESPYRPTWTKGVYPVLSDIQSAISQQSLYAAEEEGVFVGAFILNHSQEEGFENVGWKVDSPPEKTTVIHLLAVDPRFHNRGIGKQLLQKAAEVCRTNSDLAIRLDTLPHNKPGRHMYETFGFEWCGDIPLTYPSTGTILFSTYEYRL